MTFSSYRNIISFIAVCAFIWVAVFGFLSIVPDHHHEPGCPFMIGEQSICPMGLLDHIRAWQGLFTVSLPPLLYLIFVLFTVVVLWQFTHPPNFLQFAKQKFKNFSHYLLYQELFSQGILNPKAP